MEWIASPQVWIAFATLLALEIVLGIDNVIFIAVRWAESSSGLDAASLRCFGSEEVGEFCGWCRRGFPRPLSAASNGSD